MGDIPEKFGHRMSGIPVEYNSPDARYRSISRMEKLWLQPMSRTSGASFSRPAYASITKAVADANGWARNLSVRFFPNSAVAPYDTTVGISS